MNLHIDSTDNLKSLIKLGDKQFIKTYSRPQEQDVLGAINSALTQEGLKFSDLTSITVNPGPGSFTGSRVGVAIANSLAFALGIKVNDQDPPLFPVYSQAPHVTTPKPHTH